MSHEGQNRKFWSMFFSESKTVNIWPNNIFESSFLKKIEKEDTRTSYILFASNIEKTFGKRAKEGSSKKISCVVISQTELSKT